MRLSDFGISQPPVRRGSADLFYDHRKTTVDDWQRAPEAAEQHRRIYQAIKAGDVAKSRVEMGDHLMWAQRDQRMED